MSSNELPKTHCPKCKSDLIAATASSLRCNVCGHQFDPAVPATYSQPDIRPRPVIPQGKLL